MFFNTVVQFDQKQWQQSFFSSLERYADQEHEPSQDHPMDEKRSLDANKLVALPSFPVWRNEEFDTADFQEALTSHHSSQVIDKVHQLFLTIVPELEKSTELAIAYTGSDGRFEKLSPFSSPIELVVILKKGADLNSPLMEKIRRVVSENPDLMYPEIETKVIGEDLLMSYYRPLNHGGTEERPFPTRALDANLLMGCTQLFLEFRKTFFRELQNPANKKRLRTFKKSVVQPTASLFKKTMQNTDTSHVDCSQGKLHYDAKRIKGVKYPYLRMMQYKLGMNIFQAIQEKRISEEEFLKLPSTTIDRIRWLAQKHLLDASGQEVKHYQKAYITSLIWFGIAQKNFEVLHQKVTEVPAEDLQDMAQVIARFSEKFVA